MNLAVIGLQWGDEGKGSVVDYLTQDFDFVVRYKGGNNAGHTVKVDNEVYKLHLVPSGITQGKRCFIGNGVVVDPLVLRKEIEGLQDRGVEVSSENLTISEKAHLIMPWHKIFDGIRGGKIGTTGRGIGPCYSDGVARDGVRLYHAVDRHGDIDKRSFEKRIRDILREKNDILGKVFEGRSLPKEWIVEDYCEAIDFLRPYIGDAAGSIRELIESGLNCLLEGAQANLLDIDFGTYPYVTSSNCGVAGIHSGTGVNIDLDAIVGVTKAYTTRVGKGPFPTELVDEDRINREVREFVLSQEEMSEGEYKLLDAEEQSALRIKHVEKYTLSPGEKEILKDSDHPDYEHVLGKKMMIDGKEFGTTTGRPRRVGWLDAVAVRYSVVTNGVTHLALTKQAPLDDFEEIAICTGYEIDGEVINDFPCRLRDLERVKPQYEWLPGWEGPTEEIDFVGDVPEEFGDYILKLEEETGVDVGILSMGAERAYKIIIDENLVPQ